MYVIFDIYSLITKKAHKVIIAEGYGILGLATVLKRNPGLFLFYSLSDE